MALVQVGFCCSADVPGSLDLSMAFELKTVIPVFLNASLTLAGEKNLVNGVGLYDFPKLCRCEADFSF